MIRSVVVILFLSALTPAWAQSTFGSIRGAVRDPGGSVMPSVKVIVTNEGTGLAKEVVSDASGNYEATHLNPGNYRVSAEAEGFQRFVNERLLLETNQILRIDITMMVGQVTDTITVVSQAPVIESETGTVSDVRTGRQMRELPMNFVRGDAFGGGIFKYMSLSPGSFRYEGASSHSFGGSRSFQNSFLMDGISLGDQGGGQVTPMQPSFESVQEMRLTMVNNSAEYGAVATVTVTSKSGTNELHGSIFQQYSSGGLNARNFFQSSRPSRVYHQFGGSIGGPIVTPGYDGRNRSFFFFALEGNRNSTQSIFNSSVPSLALRQGDFSQVRNSAGNLIVVRDPATGQPFSGNIIPAARFSSVSTRAQERFFLPPNFGDPSLLNQNLRDAVANQPSWNHFDTRLDHRLSTRNSFFGRFSWRNMPTPVPEGQLPNIGLRDQLRKIRNFSFTDTHLFSSRVVNEFRAGYSWHENRFAGPLRGLDIVRDLGIRGVTSLDEPGVPNFVITGFSQITQIAGERSQDMIYDIVENVTWITGRHSLKIGANLKRQQASRNPIPITTYGRYDFTGGITGFAYSDFLLGIPQVTQRFTPRSRTYGRNQVYAFYVQDDFRVHQKLTLNLGLRYEWMNPFADKFGRMFNFDPVTGALVVPDETVRSRDVSPIFPSQIPILTAAQTGLPVRGLRTADGNNFDPRAGLAWRPFGHARTVVRAGMGVFRNNLSSSTFNSLTTGPFVSNETFNNRIVDGVPLFQFPEPFLAVGSLGAQDINAVGVNLFNPYTIQSNFTIEQEVAQTGLRLSYISTRSINLLYRRNLNQPAASTVPFNNNRRPYPVYRNITFTDNGGSSAYNALQFEAERKFFRGLAFQAGWTWAKQLANGIDAGEQGATIQDAYNRAADRGDDLYLMRHRFIGSSIWEIPVGPRRRYLNQIHPVAGHILGGWQITGVVLLQGGQRFTPTFTGTDPSNTQNVGGRPDRIANGNLPKGERTLSRWFDASAFAALPANLGRFGNSAIGVLEGPGTQNLSLGLFKNIFIRERMRIELNFSATNAFNHPNFRNPNANISAPNAVGQITAQQGQDESGPRTVILGTRIEF
jgi:hypothetical protein